MALKNFIVAIELGSTKITGIAGQHRPDGTIAVLAVVREDATQCIRKGVVYNIDKTVQCITNVVQKLRAQLHAGIKHVFIGVGGQSIHSERNVIIRDMQEAMPVTQQMMQTEDEKFKAMHVKYEPDYSMDAVIDAITEKIMAKTRKDEHLNP